MRVPSQTVAGSVAEGQAATRNLRESWWWLLAFLLVLLLLGVLDRTAEYRRIDRSERERLEVQGRVVEEHIGSLLATADHALVGLRDDFNDARTLAARQPLRLRALAAVMPGVRSIFTLDARGVVVSANFDELVGLDFSGRAYFQWPRTMGHPETLYLSAPFKTLQDQFTVTLARELRRDEGEFTGLAVVSMNPIYFSGVMRSVLYAPDMRIELFHGDGVRFVEESASAQAADGGSARMSVERLVRPPTLPLDKPLKVVLSRQVGAIFAPWRQQALWMLAFWGLFAGAASLALWLMQQRRRALDAQAQAHLAVLQESEESLSITLSSIGDAVVATDASGAVQRMNPCAERLIGLRLAQARGRPLAEVFRIVNAGTGAPVADPVALVLERGEVVGLANHTVLLAHDGQEYQIADSAAPIRNAAGAIVGVVLVFSDVTERYRAEQLVREREHQLSLLIDSLSGPVSQADGDGRYLYANAAHERWFGFKPAEAIGRSHAELLPPALYARIQPLLLLARLGERQTDEISVESPADGTLHALITLVPYRDEAGHAAGSFTVLVDITERKRAEAALRASEERWRAVIDNLAEGLILSNDSHQTAYWNRAALKMHGFESASDEMLREENFTRAHEVLDMEGAPLPRSEWPLTRLRRGDTLHGLQLQVRRRDGSWSRMFSYNGATVLDASGRRVAFLSMIDITEARLAEAALERSLAQMERTGALGRVGGWELDLATGMLELSDEIRHLMDIGPDVTMDCHQAHALFYPPEVHEVLEKARAHALAQGEGWDVYSSFTTATGRQLWVRSLGQAVMRGGRVVGLSGAVQDVTDLHRSRQQVEESAAMLRMAGQTAHLGGWVIDAATHEVTLSDGLRGLLDLAPDTPVSLEGGIAMYPPGSREVIAEVVRACLEEGVPFDVELEIITAAKRRLQIRSTGMAVRNEQGEIVRIQGAFQDISDRKKADAERRALEAQLRESQKMESVGTLAGGIAHDFNNILGAILGNVSLAREDVGPGHPALLSLDQIQTAGLRARAMVQQILAFSRRQPHELVMQPLRPVVEESLALLRATLPARIRLTTRFSTVALQVKADATQIQQVILNLCTNAWHATQGSSGVIEVGLEHVALDAAAAHRLSGLTAGDYAHVWVGDTGTGIDPAILPRIFEPFFTTKPVGQGTGLGLAVVHGIVASHRGAISVDSQLGKGTTFHLYFPAALGAGPGDATAADGTEPLRGQGQHVLYIDDDEVMQLLVERLLRRLNYRVTSHSDPRKALADFRTRPRSFDLVVTDFNMPEMSGLEVAEAVKRLEPGLPVVVSSGYLSEELRANATRLGVHSLLQKENTFEELAEVVHRILAQAGRGGTPAQGGS